MPRVAIVTHYFAPHVGGVETVAEAHACLLADRGWEVDVHTSRVPSTARVRSRNGIAISRYTAANFLESSLRVPMPLVAPWMIRSLEAAARRADIVVAHGHSYLTTVYAALAAARADRPFVVVQHNPFVRYGSLLSAVERTADRSLGSWVLRNAELVICVSHHTEEYVRSIDADCRTVVIPNGVDTERFRPLDSSSPPGGPRQVVTARRLVPRTGVDVLLDAWRLADFRRAEAELVIGGTGPEERRLAELAESLDGVRFTGRIEHEDLQPFLAGAWVAVMPTRTGEGFGMMAAEALGCGVPVIASAEGALPELVRDGENGILVPPEDPGALAEAMHRVVESDDLRQGLAAHARSSICSWDDVGDQVERTLLEVVNAAHPHVDSKSVPRIEAGPEPETRVPAVTDPTATDVHLEPSAVVTVDEPTSPFLVTGRPKGVESNGTSGRTIDDTEFIDDDTVSTDPRVSRRARREQRVQERTTVLLAVPVIAACVFALVSATHSLWLPPDAAHALSEADALRGIDVLGYSHPPGFPAIVAVLLTVFGRFDAALVAVSLAVALFAVATYVLLRLWFSRPASAIAALCAAAFPLLAEAVSWGGGPTLLGNACAVAAIAAAERWCRSTDRRHDRLAPVVGVLLGLTVLAHPFSFAVAAFVCAGRVVGEVFRRRAVRWRTLGPNAVLGWFVVVTATVPFWALSWSYYGVVDPPGAISVGAPMISTLRSFLSWSTRESPVFLAVAIAALFLPLFVRQWSLRLVVGLLDTAILGYVLFMRGDPSYQSRAFYFLPVLVGVLVALCFDPTVALIARLTARRRELVAAVVGTALVLATVVFGFSERLQAAVPYYQRLQPGDVAVIEHLAGGKGTVATSFFGQSYGAPTSWMVNGLAQRAASSPIAPFRRLYR